MRDNKRLKIMCVVGTRPNFMKIAPLMEEFKKESKIQAFLVHTGQHHDFSLNECIFDELKISTPDVHLNVGSGSHAAVTANIMVQFEKVLLEQKPDAVLVVGDVNSTLACALVAAKEHVPVIHVEAGLRSYDKAMPEEINRVMTDQISDLLFTTEFDAFKNLEREGIERHRIHFAGNVMIDTLKNNLKHAIPSAVTLQSLKFPNSLKSSQYAVLTMHRASNVDNPEILRSLLETIHEISNSLPVVFPMHPRTKARINSFNLEHLLTHPQLFVTEPLSYLSLLGLMVDATLVLTDSGGIQEETTALGVPCFTLRENTERPITVSEGTNIVTGIDKKVILKEFAHFLETGGKKGRIPEKWDGNSANRICQQIVNWFEEKQGLNMSPVRSTTIC